MSDVDEIKRRLNIVDVIQDYVKLQKAGANFRGRCPFHTEKTPSFFVSPEKQIWHCFGSCAKGGDAFRFLMEAESMEFREALEVLAKRAGVALKRFNTKEKNEKGILADVNELSMAFFQKALIHSKGGEKASEYLKKRGVSDESRDLFRIGYAPSSWRALSLYLEKKGFKKEHVITSGLVIKHENRRVYDRFRARVMFPIFSLTGQVVGFSGRVLAKEIKDAKYINTPQTAMYDKSRELYGLYQAKTALKDTGEAIIMEGNIDVVLSHQAGVKNAVATCGTALTSPHLSLLSRYVKKLIFSFDNDDAGRKASFRAFELASQADFTLYTLALSEGKDPADIVREKGAEGWQKEVAQKMHFMEYFWKVLSERYSIDDIEGKKSFTKEFFSLLRFVSNSIERGHWLNEFARRLNIRAEDMFDSFQKFESIDKSFSNNYNLNSSINANQSKNLPPIRDRIFQDKENLAALYFAYPDVCNELFEHIAFIKAKANFIETILKEVGERISQDELSLKAQAFWPSQYMAKRELFRIINDLEMAHKKELVKSSLVF